MAKFKLDNNFKRRLEKQCQEKAKSLAKEAREKLSGKWSKAVCINLAYMLVFFLFTILESLCSDIMQSFLSLVFAIIEVPLSLGLIISFVKLFITSVAIRRINPVIIRAISTFNHPNITVANNVEIILNKLSEIDLTEYIDGNIFVLVKLLKYLLARIK